jgi:trigger factor
VANDKAANRAVQARDLLLEKLREATDFPVPAGVVDAEIKRHLEAEGKGEDDPHGEEVREEVTDLLREQLLLDTLAEQLQVGVTQNELLEFLVRNAQQYGMEPNQFIQAAAQTGQIGAFTGEIARNKSLAVALRQVAVKDKDGNAVDLSEYIGSDELDAAGPEGAAEGAESAEAVAEESAESSESAESPESPESAESPESPESADSAPSADEAEEKPAPKKAPAKKAAAKKAPAKEAAAEEKTETEAPAKKATAKKAPAKKAPAKKAKADDAE